MTLYATLGLFAGIAAISLVQAVRRATHLESDDD